MLQNKKRIHKVLKSGMSLMLSGVLFGTVTGATFYGVNTVLTGTDTSIQSSVSSSNISYTKHHLRHRMFRQLPKTIFHQLSQLRISLYQKFRIILVVISVVDILI